MCANLSPRRGVILSGVPSETRSTRLGSAYLTLQIFDLASGRYTCEAYAESDRVTRMGRSRMVLPRQIGRAVSLPPSFASQNPAPSSEGGKGKPKSAGIVLRSVPFRAHLHFSLFTIHFSLFTARKSLPSPGGASAPCFKGSLVLCKPFIFHCPCAQGEGRVHRLG